MNNNYVIETEDLTKFYGTARGIEGVNLQVRQGEVFGFLGPNGAGKTTTMRILLDMLRPTRGHARVFGLDAQAQSVEIRKRVGNLPGDAALYDTLKGGDMLRLLGSFRPPDGTRRIFLDDELGERHDFPARHASSPTYIRASYVPRGLIRGRAVLVVWPIVPSLDVYRLKWVR